MIFGLIPNEASELTAAQETIFQGADAMPSGNYGLAFVKMLLTLVFLLSLFIITVWFLKRLIRSRLEKGSGQQKIIQVLEKKMISPNTMLYVIEVEGKRILVAESHLEVRPISEIGNEPVSVDSTPIA